MIRKTSTFLFAVAAVVLAAATNCQAQNFLTHHMREPVRDNRVQATGRAPANQIITLNVVLPLRDEAGLDRFLSEVYDPASPLYHHYLTVPEFTAMFGPTQAEYDSVVQYLKSNGLTVTGGSRDGMNVAVRGPVSAVQAAFHVNIRTYQHPTENRTFYAPDSEPTVSCRSICGMCRGWTTTPFRTRWW